MNKNLLELIKLYMSVQDYRKVAEMSGYSYSTICNIVTCRTEIRPSTEIVVEKFKELLKQKVKAGLIKVKIEFEDFEYKIT